MIIDKKSWHFQLVSFSAGGDDCVPRDLCGYTLRILLSLLGIVATGFVAAAAAAAAAFSLYLLWSVGDWVWTCIVAKQFLRPSEPAFTALFIFGLFAVATLLSSTPYLWARYEGYIYHKELKAICNGQESPAPKRNLIGAMYRGFKDKTCILLEFK
jgi:hypothetical protein